MDDDLGARLNELAGLLRDNNSSWHESVARLATGLADAGTDPAARKEALNRIRALYRGGMGSFNDIVLGFGSWVNLDAQHELADLQNNIWSLSGEALDRLRAS